MDEMDRFDSDDNSDMSQEEAEVLEAFEQLDYEQNLPMGVVAGLIGALVGAALWAWITVLTDAQIGWMAIAVGFLVGLAVRIFGKGLDKVFGIVGAVLSLLGCVGPWQRPPARSHRRRRPPLAGRRRLPRGAEKRRLHHRRKDQRRGVRIG